jgi:hypothetical protein
LINLVGIVYPIDTLSLSTNLDSYTWDIQITASYPTTANVAEGLVSNPSGQAHFYLIIDAPISEAGYYLPDIDKNATNVGAKVLAIVIERGEVSYSPEGPSYSMRGRSCSALAGNLYKGLEYPQKNEDGTENVVTLSLQKHIDAMNGILGEKFPTPPYAATPFISWQTADWGDVTLTSKDGKTIIELVQEWAELAGAAIVCDDDGFTIRVMPKYASDSGGLINAIDVLSLTRTADFGPSYNYVELYPGTFDDKTINIETEELEYGCGLKVYVSTVPHRRKLWLTSSNPNHTIVYNGTEERTRTDTVEIVEGSGSVDAADAEVDDVEWLDDGAGTMAIDDLGTISSSRTCGLGGLSYVYPVHVFTLQGPKDSQALLCVHDANPVPPPPGEEEEEVEGEEVEGDYFVVRRRLGDHAAPPENNAAYKNQGVAQAKGRTILYDSASRETASIEMPWKPGRVVMTTTGFDRLDTGVYTFTRKGVGVVITGLSMSKTPDDHKISWDIENVI